MDFTKKVHLDCLFLPPKPWRLYSFLWTISAGVQISAAKIAYFVR